MKKDTFDGDHDELDELTTAKEASDHCDFDCNDDEKRSFSQPLPSIDRIIEMFGDTASLV